MAEERFVCRRVQLEKDSRGVTEVRRVKKPYVKGMTPMAIEEYNSQMHNSGFMLQKIGVKYELAEVIVGSGRDGNITKNHFVESEEKFSKEELAEILAKAKADVEDEKVKGVTNLDVLLKQLYSIEPSLEPKETKKETKKKSEEK